MTHSTNNRGFMTIAMVILVAILVFTLAGFDLRAFIDSGEAKHYLTQGKEVVISVWERYPGPYWSSYIQPYITVIWNDILRDIIHTSIHASLTDVVNGDPTPIEKTVSELLP